VGLLVLMVPVIPIRIYLGVKRSRVQIPAARPQKCRSGAYREPLTCARIAACHPFVIAPFLKALLESEPRGASHS
jgi:hypothetical protein